MDLLNAIEVSPLASKVFQELENENGKVYIVGGTVRDMIMGIPSSHDMDIEVYHLTQDQLYEILSRFNYVKSFGKSFAIYQLKELPDYDFALPRRERKVGDKHTDFEIEVDPELPLEKAILRRDLTMNALMYDYTNQKVIDLCGGIQDIQNRIIRIVDPNHFQEDPLRVLRVASFSARFNFEVEEYTLQLCKEMQEEGMLTYLPKERIYQEYTKLLLAKYPTKGLIFLEAIEALPDYLNQSDLPYIYSLLEGLALIKDQTSDPIGCMWAGLLACCKGEVIEQIDVLYSKKLKNYIHYIHEYSQEYMSILEEENEFKYKVLLSKIDGKIPLEDILFYGKCVRIVDGNNEEYIEKLLACHTRWTSIIGREKIKPLITGRHLNKLKVCKVEEYQIIIQDAYLHQLDGMSLEELKEYIVNHYSVNQ